MDARLETDPRYFAWQTDGRGKLVSAAPAVGWIGHRCRHINRCTDPCHAVSIAAAVWPMNGSAINPASGPGATGRGTPSCHTAAPRIRRTKGALFQSRAVLSPESGTEGSVENRAGDSPALKTSNLFAPRLQAEPPSTARAARHGSARRFTPHRLIMSHLLARMERLIALFGGR